MRVIKFRGITIGGDMVYGSLSLPKNKINSSTPAGSYISNDYGMPFAYEVRPETVGKYTGFKDRNGVEIYEGDLAHAYESSESTSTMAGTLRWENCKIVFEDGTFCIMIPTTSGNKPFCLGYYCKNIEVIGNIYDPQKEDK